MRVTIPEDIPAGRIRASLEDIEESYVENPLFLQSTTRKIVWAGFTKYISAWKAVENQYGDKLLLAAWISGSFISSKLNPEDIDISPIIQQDALEHSGISSNRLKSLIGHREKVRERYHVEPFPIRWRSIESTLIPERLPDDVKTYLAQRGAMDDWWQRSRPNPSIKQRPVAPSRISSRGYLEVIFP
ncbi:MAG: hypothetical protein SOI13_05205 [Bifidobacterium mongoliense]|jgi:hypothetical protein|uniref:DUF6932 family protein n=1 Tax=Bifidobacterium mongoliense TaxID=518643 RepID=UPI002F35C937